MTKLAKIPVLLIAAVLVLPLVASRSTAQQGPLSRIEGRLLGRGGELGGIRIRLILQDGLRPVGEAMTRSDGQFEFFGLIEGNYIIDVEETPNYQATRYVLELRKVVDDEGVNRRITIPMQAKVGQVRSTAPPGVISADVDTEVPAEARGHFETALRAFDEKKTEQSITELRAALKIHPRYYAARMLLGIQLRQEKKFSEAREILEPVPAIAPKHAEPLVELGIVLIALKKRDEAAKTLKAAISLDETNWAAHLYLGWALIDENDTEAEPHFWRALKINEKEAAQAHLALARLAHRYGYPKDAVDQLEAYLKVCPEAHDANDVKRLCEKLRKELK